MKRLVDMCLRERPIMPLILALLAAGALVLSARRGVLGVTESGEPGVGLLAALPGVLGWLGLAIACGLAGAGIPRRVGSARSCGRCGYVMLEPRDRLIAACPECGNAWRWFGRAARGRRVGNARLVGAGAALVLAVLIGAAWRGEWSARLRARLPNGALVSLALGAPIEESELAWEELEQRTLTPADEARLADGLLAAREVSWLSRRAQAWLEGALASGRLGPDRVARFVDSLARVTLEAPPVLRAGEPATLRVVATPRGRESSVIASRVLLAVSSWEIRPAEADGATPRGAEDPTAARSGVWSEVGRTDPPGLTIVPGAAGELRVRVRAWLVADRARPGLRWGDDGAPVFVAPPTFVREHVMEARLPVTGP